MAKLKNYIIKKLGGYTEKEYRTINDIHYEFIPQKTSNFITLLSRVEYFTDYPPPQDWVEDKLIMGLTQQIKPYVRFYNEYDQMEMKKTVSAYVKVVDDNDGNI